MQTKKNLRQEILSRRRAMSEDEVGLLSGMICNRILSSDYYKKATDICLYMPIHNEVDVTLLFPYVLMEKRIWLPRVKDKDMDFYLYKDEDSLVVGRYGIKEPSSNVKLEADNNTLIVMPGSVFSRNNKRIGYGGGYYDRYLEEHKGVMTIAAAYDFQVLEDIPTEEFDKRPDIIITETEEYHHVK